MEASLCDPVSCAWVKKKKKKAINTIPITPPTQDGFAVLGLQLLFLGPIIVCNLAT